MQSELDDFKNKFCLHPIFPLAFPPSPHLLSYVSFAALNLGTPKSTPSNVVTSYSKTSKNNNSIAFSQPNSPMMAGGEMLSGTITNSQPSSFTSSSLYSYPIQQAMSFSPLPNMNSKPPGSQSGVSIAKPTPVPPTSAQSTSTSKVKVSSKSYGAKPGYSNSVVRPASPSSVIRMKEGDMQQQQPSLEGAQFIYSSGGQMYLSQMIHPSLQPQSQSYSSIQQQQQPQSHSSMQQQPQSQSHSSMQQQQSQSHPAVPPQPQSLPHTQPQSTLSKLLALSQVPKPAADMSPGPPAPSAKSAAGVWLSEGLV